MGDKRPTGEDFFIKQQPLTGMIWIGWTNRDDHGTMRAIINLQNVLAIELPATTQGSRQVVEVMASNGGKYVYAGANALSFFGTLAQLLLDRKPTRDHFTSHPAPKART